MIDSEMGENLRIYNRQLTTQLKVKEGQLTDLQTRFSKLQGRFAELDYAFRKNLLLHQQQMIEIYDLRLSQKELRNVDKDRWNQLCSLKDQLVQVTNENEAAKNDLASWKQAVIDQKKFYEGKLEDCVRECKLGLEANEIAHQKTLCETQSLAEQYIQESGDRSKLNVEKVEIMKKKVITLQGEVDVSQFRAEKLASLLQSFPGINENLRTIGSCIIKVLRSLNTPCTDYDEEIKKLHQELLHQSPDPTVIPEVNISDYKTLKTQNLVLKEVVKKLKAELTKVDKSDVISPQLLIENSRLEALRNELNLSNSRNEKLLNLLAEKNAPMKRLEIKTRENIEEPELESRAVQTDEKLGDCFDNREGRNFNDDGSEEAHWKLLREEGAEKFKERARRDMIKSFGLNLEPSNSERSFERSDVTLKNTQKVERGTESYLSGEKYEHSQVAPVRLQPIESHLNSIQYKEYTISVSNNHNLKIRHPIASGCSANIFPFRSVYSEEEYQNIPIDEGVLYFDSNNTDAVPPKSKMMNCATQTLSTPAANVFTQTIASKETFTGQANTGIKILNSERRAMERSLRDLEKTVAEAGEDTLGQARSLIVNTSKFPSSEEFFDCVRYLSQSKST